LRRNFHAEKVMAMAETAGIGRGQSYHGVANRKAFRKKKNGIPRLQNAIHFFWGGKD
jgi:hypothetical protein